MQRRLLLKVDDVSNTYHDTDGFKKIVTPVLDHVSFDVYKGEIVGLVGESGSGKSTLVKCILGMAEHTGTITHYSERPQMVFQNPASALNPSMSVGRILEEALILKGGMSHTERMELVRSTIEAVGLKEENIHSMPSQLSGGQKQRVCIAAAIITKPELVILDEPVSALDVTIQAQILKLLADLRMEFDLSYLFISHDLNVVYQLCDYVIVLKKGRVVEQGDIDTVYDDPKDDYTKALLEAAELMI